MRVLRRRPANRGEAGHTSHRFHVQRYEIKAPNDKIRSCLEETETANNVGAADTAKPFTTPTSPTLGIKKWLAALTITPSADVGIYKD